MIRYRHVGIIGRDGDVTTVAYRHLLVADNVDMMVAINLQNFIFHPCGCVTNQHHATVILLWVLIIV